MKNNFKKGFVIQGMVAIIALILIGGGAYYAGVKKVEVKEAPKNTELVDDWKTYTNNKYGFEFKYPSNISIKAEDNRVIMDLGSSMEKTYSKIEDEKINVNRDLVIEFGLVSTENCYKENSTGEKFASTDNDYSSFITDSGIELGPLYIGGKNTSTLGVNRDPFSTIHNGNCYQFTITSKYPLNMNGSNPFSNGAGSGTGVIAHSILSTFKFINTISKLDTTNWKTYTNSEYGIEFKYPQGLIVLDRSYKTPGGPTFPALMIIAPNQEKDNSYVIVGSRTLGSTAPEISCNNTFGRCKEFGSNIVYTRSTDANIVGLFDRVIDTVKFISPSNSQPLITVLSPNGGERLAMNSNFRINWKNSDTRNGGSIYLSPKGKEMDKSLVVDRFAYKGVAYDWKVGEIFSTDFTKRISVSPGDYKIGVCLSRLETNFSGGECEWSDNYFTITN